jgi:hypothetical protein
VFAYFPYQKKKEETIDAVKTLKSWYWLESLWRELIVRIRSLEFFFQKEIFGTWNLIHYYTYRGEATLGMVGHLAGLALQAAALNKCIAFTY